MIRYRDGWYRCRVKRMETVRRHEEQNFRYRSKQALRRRRYMALARRRKRKEQDGSLPE